MAVIKLYYFDVAARAEPTRLAFTIGNVPFEDVRIPKEEWVSKYKQMSPSGQVPMIEVDGVKIVESAAILTYAGAVGGLLPTCPKEKALSVQAMAMAENICTTFHEIYRDSSEANVKEVTKADGLLEKTLKTIDNVVKPNAEGFVGSKLSIGEIVLYSNLRAVETFYKPYKIDYSKYPNLKKIFNAVHNHPAVQKYYTTHNYNYNRPESKN